MFLLPLNVLCTQTPVTIQMPRIEATRDKAVCLWPRHPSLIGHLTTVRRRLTASRVPSDTSTTWPWAAPGLPEHGTAHPRCTSGGHVPRPRLGTLRTGPRPAVRWTLSGTRPEPRALVRDSGSTGGFAPCRRIQFRRALSLPNSDRHSNDSEPALSGARTGARLTPPRGSRRNRHRSPRSPLQGHSRPRPAVPAAPGHRGNVTRDRRPAAHRVSGRLAFCPMSYRGPLPRSVRHTSPFSAPATSLV